MSFLVLQAACVRCSKFLHPILVHLVLQVVLHLATIFIYDPKKLLCVLLLHLEDPELLVDPLHLTPLPFVVELAREPRQLCFL